MSRSRAFSGVQPTGQLHLGNYLGALKPWVAAQGARENLFCVVDLHALTIPENIDSAELAAASRLVAATFWAAGIDPTLSHVFVQSHIREHSELAWVLTCLTPLGWLEKMTQFKSKSEGRGSVGSGLLMYPVLQAADILLYDAAVVPVGEDQRQHIELAREIAARFNHLFGETFVVPEISTPVAGARVMGLDEPTSKMSKSLLAARPHHAVLVTDDPKKIKKSFSKAVTDSGCDYDPETASPGVKNLMGILSAVTGEAVPSIAARFEGQGYGYLKVAVAEAVTEELAPVQRRLHELLADPAELDRQLAASAAEVRETAAATMARVRAAVGIG